MYSQIEKTFLNPNADWSIFQDSISYSKYVSGDVTLEYFGIDNIELFRKQHIRKFSTIPPSRVRYVKLTGSGILQPHVDHNTTAALNYYISANEDKTIFYKTRSDNISPISYPGKEEANVYNLDSLIPTGEFIACSNQTYLLDVSKIHAVIKIDPTPRIFIAYLWENHSYEQLLKDINSL